MTTSAKASRAVQTRFTRDALADRILFGPPGSAVSARKPAHSVRNDLAGRTRLRLFPVGYHVEPAAEARHLAPRPAR